MAAIRRQYKDTCLSDPKPTEICKIDFIIAPILYHGALHGLISAQT